LSPDEATRFAGLIQRAFPAMRMEQRFYIRALLPFDAKLAHEAILSAIENRWRYLPTVYEMKQVLAATRVVEQSSSCHHDVPFMERCPFCIAEAGDE